MTAQDGTSRGRPPGRRTGDSGTRDAILDASLALFAERGFEGTSVRAVAAAAGVDPALVRHFFGDKDALFAVAVADRTSFPQRIVDALGGDQQHVGERVTDTYLHLWEDPTSRPILLALIRSATTSQRAADMLREALWARVSSGRPAAANDPEQLQRIAIAAAHLFGIAVARHVLRMPPLTALDHDSLVRQVAPTVQRYLTGTHL